MKSMLKLIICLSLLVVFAVPAQNVYHRRGAFRANNLPPAADILAWWDLDETSGSRADSTGTYSLTDNNTVGFTAGIQSNGSTHVAGSNEYLSNAAFGNTWHGSDFSIGGWMRINDAAFYACILQQFAGSSEALQHFNLRWNTANSYFELVVEDSTDTVFTCQSDSTFSTTGVWKFICATRSSNTLTLYVDGVAQADTETIGAVKTGDVDLEIGRISTTLYSSASFDEVFVADTAFSPAQIAALYNSGAGVAWGDLP